MANCMIASHDVDSASVIAARCTFLFTMRNLLHPVADTMAGIKIPPGLFRNRQGVVVVIFLMLCQFGCHLAPKPSYTWDVYPILQQRCLTCHSPPDGKGYLASGLDMTSYDSLMHGSRYGPIIVPGDSRHSLLNMVVEARVHPSPQMSQKLFPLEAGEEEILRQWVNSGAPDN